MASVAGVVYGEHRLLDSLLTIVGFFGAALFGCNLYPRHMLAEDAPQSIGKMFGVVFALWLAWALVYVVHGTFVINKAGWLFWTLFPLAALATFLFVVRWVHRNWTPWRRMYFPLIDRYAALSGFHLGVADRTGVEFTPKKPLAVLIKEIEPTRTDEEVELVLNKWEVDFDSDHHVFEELLREGKGSDADISIKLKRLRNSMQNGDNRNVFFVRYVIGKFIEAKFGKDELKAYWRAIFRREVS
jgi:hypothetical protein